MSPPVLVLDGDERSALATVRALGRAGLTVFAAARGSESLAGRSRYCAGHFGLPSPLESPNEFPEAVFSMASRLSAGVVFSMTDASTMLLAPAKPGERSVKVAAAPGDVYEVASDKARLVEVAMASGVPVPRTLIASSASELREAASELGFPCVLKPARSRLLLAGRIVQTSVRIARSRADLESFAENAWLSDCPCLVQEFVVGSGAGVFTLYGQGGPVAWFAHRRLREKPPSGGVSVLCESVAVDPRMREYADRLLSHFGWFGPAMVEFRVDPQGRPWLMEINGRFWGSLQLAIDCGVDFPTLLYRLCRGEDVRGPESYQVGLRLRWLLGDLDHLLLQLRGKGTATSFGGRLKSLGSFLNFFSPNTRFEVLRRDDLAPFRYELGQWLRSLGRG